MKHILFSIATALALALPLAAEEKPNILKADYRTACIGKWHLGWDWDAIRNPGKKRLAPDGHDWSKPVPGGPLQRGFDYYFGDDVPNFPPYAWIENDRILIAPTVPFTPIPTPQPGDEGGGRMSGHDSRDGAMVEGWRLDAVPPRIAERAVEWIGEQRDSDKPFFLQERGQVMLLAIRPRKGSGDASCNPRRIRERGQVMLLAIRAGASEKGVR